MKRFITFAAALLTLSGLSVATAASSSASVCQPNGGGCTKAGTYPGPNAVINSNYGGDFKVVWTKSVVQPYSSGVPLYWTAYVTYTNFSAASQTLTCPGTNALSISEHMSGGSGDDGTVLAESSNCTGHVDLTVTVPPGGTYTAFATFHNVPWPGSAVAITWGDIGTSPYVYPFQTIKACVFDAPTGVTVIAGKEIFGHVGWGFELPSGNWEFGANEGPGNLFISKTWYATGTWAQMLSAFRNKGHNHAAKFYTQYKCATVSATSASISAAGSTVLREFNEIYVIPGQDCEAQVYNVLTAFGVKQLPSDTSILYWPSPNNWFNHLSGAGFGGASRL
jgi:hypothetical protein